MVRLLVFWLYSDVKIKRKEANDYSDSWGGEKYPSSMKNKKVL